MTHDVHMALFGACAAASAMIGLAFIRYWSLSKDRLYVLFACAFWLFAAGWVTRVASGQGEQRPFVYVFRLIGFLLIIAAIIDKNRRAE